MALARWLTWDLDAATEGAVEDNIPHRLPSAMDTITGHLRRRADPVDGQLSLRVHREGSSPLLLLLVVVVVGQACLMATPDPLLLLVHREEDLIRSWTEDHIEVPQEVLAEVDGETVAEGVAS